MSNISVTQFSHASRPIKRQENQKSCAVFFPRFCLYTIMRQKKKKLRVQQLVDTAMNFFFIHYVKTKTEFYQTKEQREQDLDYYCFIAIFWNHIYKINPMLFLIIPRSAKTHSQNITTFKPFSSFSTFTFTTITHGCHS